MIRGSVTLYNTSDCGQSHCDSWGNLAHFRGTLCESVVPDMTFKDAEEGDTHKLQLTVVRLDAGNSFLYYKDRKLQGLALAPGDYQYRLEARDRRGQVGQAGD